MGQPAMRCHTLEHGGKTLLGAQGKPEPGAMLGRGQARSRSAYTLAPLRSRGDQVVHANRIRDLVGPSS